MSNLVYAALVIIIIWAGIFFYLVALDRRLKRLEKLLGEGSVPGGEDQPVRSVEAGAEAEAEIETEAGPSEG